MVEVFDYEGREWLNIGIPSGIFALIAIVQFFMCVSSLVPTMPQSLWYYFMIQFGTFFCLVFAYETKKFVPSLCALVSAVFLAVVDIPLLINSMQPYSEVLGALGGIMSIIAVAITVIDVTGVITIKELNEADKIKNDFLLVAPFLLIAISQVVWFTLWMPSTDIVWMLQHIFVLLWGIGGTIVTGLQAYKKKPIELSDNFGFDNLIFIFGLIGALCVVLRFLTIGGGFSIL